MPSQKASSKKVHVTQESSRGSNQSFTSQSSYSTSYCYDSYDTRYDTRYESPGSSNASGSEYSSSTSSRPRESLLRVPDHPTKDTITMTSRGKVDVFQHELRWEDKSEPRSREATVTDYGQSKSRSKRHYKCEAEVSKRW